MKKFLILTAFVISALVTGAMFAAPLSFTHIENKAVVQAVAGLVFAGLLMYSTWLGRHDFVGHKIITNGPGVFNPYRRITAQAKIVGVNDKLGNPALKNNQGTTVEVFDYVKVVSTVLPTTLQFFQNVNAKTFPFTNLQQNQLQAGEALAIEYMFFTYMIVTDATGEVQAFGSITELIKGFNVAQYVQSLDNNRVMKPLSLARQSKQFNPHGKTAENYVFYPDTDLTIPPQVQFSAQLQIPPVTSPAGAGETLYVGVHWTGTGAILNIKQSV